MNQDSIQTHTAEHRDDFGAKLGMWIFLFTEIFFFGGLFLVYAVYRAMYPADFHAASLHLDAYIGAVNSVLLLTSSMTISIALIAVQKGNNLLSSRLIGVTLMLAVIFLVNKYFEWDHKILLNLYPGSELMLSLKHGYILFFGLYFFMTGLHALHIMVGLVLLSICLYKVKSGKINESDNILFVNSTLYWHLVDLIWIFLFPLLYLIT
jgi:cytochrome c oxidase subunit III